MSCMSLEECLDSGISLPISDVPTFGDVTVTGSHNVNFGNTNIFHDGCIVTQIIYRNLNSVVDNERENVSQSDEILEDGSIQFAPADDRQEQTVESQNTQEHHEVPKWWIQILPKKFVALMICILASFVIAVVVVSAVLLERRSNDEEYPSINTVDEAYNLTQLRLIERREWSAVPPTRSLDKVEHPVPYVFITDTGKESCNSQTDCKHRVLMTQSRFVKYQNLMDIPYNFLVGGDGCAYEGCGWDFAGIHSGRLNKKIIGISFIGTFDSVGPPKQQLLAAQQLIELGVKEGKIANDYKLLGHRQVAGDRSPGDALYEIIKTWPRWSPTT